MLEKISGRYDDIINLPHHISAKHSHMPISDRAAQFAPFAALVGHDQSIAETSRITDSRITLGEDAGILIGRRLELLSECLDERPVVNIEYFVPDSRKSGGKYVIVTGIIKKIDVFESCIILEDSTRIPMDEIYSVDSSFFGGVDCGLYLDK